MVPDDLSKAANLFKGDLPHSVKLSPGYNSWVQEWKQRSSEDVSDTLIGALKECSVLSYTNMKALLVMALTLPIISCENERSFSQLKLIKTARRTTLSESRLSSLALMKIDRGRCNNLLSEQNMENLFNHLVNHIQG